MKRLHFSAGIAIGPILFILAILGILATVFAAGTGGSLGTAGIADRITNDIVGQANLIRSKISECQMQYLINGTNYASAPCLNDAYPCSDKTNGDLVSALTCPNDPLDGSDQRSIWTGLRVASLPPPTQGFAEWMYINAGEDGGRCIWTAPTGTKSTGIVDGLTRAATKFSTKEMDYDPTSNSQKVVVFITRPNGSGTIDSHCVAP
ncbi:MAG: hypothetical protein PHD48_04620 [Alphaproteobacteria bacterium]|nr:hypothetical protein [Alphaproteobacteria bacterium]